MIGIYPSVECGPESCISIGGGEGEGEGHSLLMELAMYMEVNWGK